MRTPPRKFAEALAKEYQFSNGAEGYFDYIVGSLINGQRQQVKDLFNAMKKSSQEEFLNEYLKDDDSHQASTRRICTAELCR